MKFAHIFEVSSKYQSVKHIVADNDNNPDNVKHVENLLKDENKNKLFFTIFDTDVDKLYKYDDFLKADGAFPNFCKNVWCCKQTLATLLAHIQHESMNLQRTDECHPPKRYCDDETNEERKKYICTSNAHRCKSYHGRGALQISWNYNYGKFSEDMLLEDKLLDNPECVSKTWLNFAAALWFFVTEASPKPSMLQVTTGEYQPNKIEKKEIFYQVLD